MSQLIVKSLNQLLDEPDTDDELREAEYRRGVRDGVGLTINGMYEMPLRFAPVSSDLLAALFRYWQHLEQWQQMPLNQQIEPPQIEWNKQAAGEISSPVPLALDSTPSAKCPGIKI